MMASWTPNHSRILSQMLDKVVGTPEVIDIRQDFCRIGDGLKSTLNKFNVYFTGSKAEGLDLQGSDFDFMFDMNDSLEFKVIQSLDENLNIFPNGIFLMDTDNAPPCFALLQHVSQTIEYTLYVACQSVNGFQYISSDLFAQDYFIYRQNNMTEGEIFGRQGPSVEYWNDFEDKSGPGSDNVPSIRCNFWPNEAAEWIHRSRYFEWPTTFDISSIIEFGFHLVPIGHPLSDMKLMEWRFSFSMAERALVWSFNHVQLQCYALMKLILKEFIKVRCNPQNQVLCSYFIKTFLFWKYESTKLNFWRADNLRECIRYLLSEFSQCIRQGVLRHYFIPRFNLLSIKLTRVAQIELLQLFDIIIQKDISVVKECKTLKDIWSEFLKVRENLNNINISTLKRNGMLMNDMCMLKYAGLLYSSIHLLSSKMDIHQMSSNRPLPSSFKTVSQIILSIFCKTSLKTIMLRKCLFMHIWTLVENSNGSGYKSVYQLHKAAQNKNLSYDISTCKLWCAILLYMKGDCLSTLDIVNQVLSSIPAYVMYEDSAINEVEQLYGDMFLDSHSSATQRARKAWMFILKIIKNIKSMPIGIRIEAKFGDLCILLSPLTCLYYLQFLCYHEMRQYDNRDRSLWQLTDLAIHKKPHGDILTSYNIAGHCLLLAGKRDDARFMFIVSYITSQLLPPCDKYNSALWYLQTFF